MDVVNPGSQPAVPPAAPPTPPPVKPNNKLLIAIIAGVVGLSFLGWLGSFVMGKVASFGVRKAIEAGTGMKIDEQGKAVSFKGKDGSEMKIDTNAQGGSTVTYKNENGETGVIETQTGDTAKPKELPKSFPADIPVMPGMVLTDTYSASQGTTSSFVMKWTTKTSLEQTVAYYTDAVPKNGWTSASTMDTGEAQYLSFEKTVDEATGTKNTVTFIFAVDKESGSLGVSLTAETHK